jgi:hypothetical protein
MESSDTVKRRAERVEARQFFRADPPARRALGSSPTRRPDRYCTQPLGLPRLDPSFQGSCQDWDKATGRKATGTGRGPPMYGRRRQDRRTHGYHHLQCDPIGHVRFWDYRSLAPFSTVEVLVKIGIERHGRKASGTGRGPPFHQRRRLHAERLAHHLHRDTLGAVRNL